MRMLDRIVLNALEFTNNSSRFQQASEEDGMPDFTNMTEEEQIAFAMQMSMQDQREFMSLSVPSSSDGD